MRFPMITVVIGALAAVVYWVPSLQEWLVYERDAILSGELWRLFTWPLVHFNGSHFGYDVLAFAIAGGLVEAHGVRRFGTLCFVTTVLAGAVMILAEPQLHFCGGLSALATMATALLCLEGMTERGLWGWICRIGLLMAFGKTVVENATGASLILRGQDTPLVIVPVCHVVGALVAVVYRLCVAGKCSSRDDRGTLPFRNVERLFQAGPSRPGVSRSDLGN